MSSVGIDANDFFYLTAAFQFAYALFEVPSGWMGDSFGPRSTLLRIVIWWSFFIALTACAGLPIPGLGAVGIGFTLLVIIQFLFGMGEAGAFPNMTRSLYNWFPASQRGFAQGTIWLSARLMGGLTPVIWVLLTLYAGLNWRQALWLFSGLACIWCLVFYFYFRNHPEEHPGTNQAERDIINLNRVNPTGHHGVPWKIILSSSTLWFMCGMYVVTNFCWYFMMYSLPDVLKGQFANQAQREQGQLFLAFIAGSPLLVGMFGCLLGGYLTDWYVQRTGDRKWGRRIFAMIGYGMAGVCYLFAAAFMHNLFAFAICVMAMGFFNDLVMGSAWATCQDVGRRYAAIVSGCMNMVGNLGGALGVYITGSVMKAHAADRPTGITIMFVTYAIIYFIGVLIWLGIDASKPIVPDPAFQDAGETIRDE